MLSTARGSAVALLALCALVAVPRALAAQGGEFDCVVFLRGDSNGDSDGVRYFTWDGMEASDHLCDVPHLRDTLAWVIESFLSELASVE